MSETTAPSADTTSEAWGQATGAEVKGKPSMEDVLTGPIPGPGPVEPLEHPWEYRPLQHVSWMQGTYRATLALWSMPAKWIRENIVLPSKGPKYYYYHRKFKRAVPIDECYLNDEACFFEANIEYRRVRLVDKYTLELLRFRRDACHYWQVSKHGEKYFPSDDCKDIKETYERESTNYHIKYGDLHYGAGAVHAYMKQKHRMIMERRIALRKEQEAAGATTES